MNRRTFIASSIAGAVASQLPVVVKSSQQESAPLWIDEDYFRFADVSAWGDVYGDYALFFINDGRVFKVSESMKQCFESWFRGGQDKFLGNMQTLAKRCEIPRYRPIAFTNSLVTHGNV